MVTSDEDTDLEIGTSHKTPSTEEVIFKTNLLK